MVMVICLPLLVSISNFIYSQDTLLTWKIGASNEKDMMNLQQKHIAKVNKQKVVHKTRQAGISTQGSIEEAQRNGSGISNHPPRSVLQNMVCN